MGGEREGTTGKDARHPRNCTLTSGSGTLVLVESCPSKYYTTPTEHLQEVRWIGGREGKSWTERERGRERVKVGVRDSRGTGRNFKGQGLDGSIKALWCDLDHFE